MRTKKTWLENIQTGTGKKVARAFFEDYKTHEEVTKELYPKAYKQIRRAKIKKNYVMPIVTSHFKEWQTLGFFDKSKPLRKLNLIQLSFISEELKKNLKYLPKDYCLSLLNLEPIYKFCKERNIEFSDREKEFLKLALLSDHLRKDILKEFPEEDIINAVLKYYAKNCILRYLYLLREIRENPEKYKKEKAKAEELNHPRTNEGKWAKKWHEKTLKAIEKKYGGSNKITSDFDEIKVIAYSLPITPATNLFWDYLNTLEEEKDLISSLDAKILNALKVYPSPIERTPTRLVKKVLRPDQSRYHLDNSNGIDLYMPLYKLLINKKQQEII